MEDNKKIVAYKYTILIPDTVYDGDTVFINDDITLEFHEGSIDILSTHELKPTETFKSVQNVIKYYGY